MTVLLPRLTLAAIAVALLPFGCHAQQPKPNDPAASLAASGKPVPRDLARKVEVILRQKANLPPGSTVVVGGRQPAELPGYDDITVLVSNDGNLSKPIHFLLSADGKTLAQFNKFDISADPRDLISPAGRPPRGGPENAPVLIVGFDDLECPFCAKMHEQIFPALLARYGDKVRVVYKDYPLDQHPWAMHAAIDTNCLGAQSVTGYWNEVDYIHAHAGDFGGDPTNPKADKTLPRANEQLDKLTRDGGQFQKVDLAKLNACIEKQDASAINASKKLGDSLGVDSTPSLFVNGDKIDGAVPLEFFFGVVDDALRAQGVEPPPPYAPKPDTTAPAQPTPPPTR